MLPTDKIKAYSNLQQIALNLDDTNALLNLFLPKTLDCLISMQIPLEFLCVMFVNESGEIGGPIFIDKNHKEGTIINDKNIIKKEALQGRLVQWRTNIQSNEIITESGMEEIIEPSYFYFNQIKSLYIAPLCIAKKIVGFLLVGSARNFQPDELETIELISHTVALNFRLQDTQQSLTKITQEVYKMNAQLHQLDKLKDDFVSVASHELRTPMAAIRSYTWMAINKSDIPLSEKLKKYLTRILISTERLINLVNDMLNISRIESGRIQIDPKVFKVTDLIEEVLAEVEARAKEKGVHLEVEKENVPQVFADPDKVHQVLLNLIGNSLKFTPQDGKITISLFSDGHLVEIGVKDTGVGMAKDDISRLFQKFGRLDNSYVAMGTSGGTGLGLFICKSLVELMKGKIRASSEGLGKGAIFTFSLPVATEEVLKDAEKYRYNPTGEAKGLEPVAI